MKEVERRVLQLSYENKLSHIGSSLGVARLLEEIYQIKKPEDIIVLDEAHGALGYYALLEKYEGQDAQALLDKHGVHQNRDEQAGIHVSGGSLGLAGSISLGLAIANETRNVYCVTSDGALMEGIWFEILRLKADLQVNNLRIFVNANGWSAYGSVNVDKLEERVHSFCPDVIVRRTNSDTSFSQGLESHYKMMTKEDYKKINAN